MDEFKRKEKDQEAQKKQLTSVVEGLLRKVNTVAKKTMRAASASDTVSADSQSTSLLQTIYLTGQF